MDRSHLLVTIVLAIGTALLGATLATRVRLPSLVGYVVAGIAIGPFTPGLAGDIDAVNALAEIGVALLMFAIGVQLPMRELRNVGTVATVGALLQVIALIGAGTAVALALGFSFIEALFFGAVVSNSSSTVITKVLGDKGEVDAEHGRLALAWSTVQDISTVALVVILSAIATGRDGLALPLAVALLKVAAFLVLLVVVGRWAVGGVLTLVLRTRNRELFALSVATISLGVAYCSTLFGLSIALGAFAAGMVVAESDLAHDALGTITPLRDVFAGLFFVSIGMLIDPRFIVQHAGWVVVTLVVIVVVKGLLSAGLARLLGCSPRVALLAGALLGQSAEFSFLMARVGVDLGVMSTGVFSTLLSGAVLSVLAAPLVARAAHALAPRLSAVTQGSQHDDTSAREPLEGHTIVCGYGRVGSVVTRALRECGLPLIVIEEHLEHVRQVRQAGIECLVGDASNPILLDRAGVATAHALVVAIPDIAGARRIVGHARAANPRLRIIVRTHARRELDELYRAGASRVVLGELETAVEIARQTLRTFDVPAEDTERQLDAVRAAVNG